MKRAGYALAVAGLLAGLLAGLAGCTGAGGSGGGGGGGGVDLALPGKARAPGDVIRVSPEDGSRGCPPTGPWW